MTECLPSDLGEKALGKVLAVKSRERYEAAYIKYQKWCQMKGVKSLTDEKVLLAYFSDLSKIYSAATIWTLYSMIRLMISEKNNVDIGKYSVLVSSVKKNPDQPKTKPKKQKVFSKDDVTKFLINAQDDVYLFMKAALIIGLSGACSKQELTELLSANVKDNNHYFYFYLLNTKTKTAREFVVSEGNIPGVNLVEIIRKYAALRPKHTYHDRFFVHYKDNKCTIHPVGVVAFTLLTKNIASYLKLDSPQLYARHCLRLSSASLLADSGADILTLKRNGGSKSTTVAESCAMDKEMKVFDETAALIYGSVSSALPSGSPKEPCEAESTSWCVKTEPASPDRGTTEVDQDPGSPTQPCVVDSKQWFVKIEPTSPARDTPDVDQNIGSPKEPCEAESTSWCVKTEPALPDRGTTEVNQDPGPAHDQMTGSDLSMQSSKCPQTAQLQSDLQIHVHSMDKEFIATHCLHCKFCANCRSNINSVCKKIRAFQCPHCKYKSSKEIALKHHIDSVHLKIKPFLCPHCEHKAVKKHHLQQHIDSVHKKIRAFLCPHCDYKTCWKNILELHIDCKHKKKKLIFLCPHCDYKTNWNKCLKLHIESKHKKKKLIYLCPHCEYRTSQRNNLINHFDSVHKK